MDFYVVGGKKHIKVKISCVKHYLETSESRRCHTHENILRLSIDSQSPAFDMLILPVTLNLCKTHGD